MRDALSSMLSMVLIPTAGITQFVREALVQREDISETFQRFVKAVNDQDLESLDDLMLASKEGKSPRRGWSGTTSTCCRNWISSRLHPNEAAVSEPADIQPMQLVR